MRMLHYLSLVSLATEQLVGLGAECGRPFVPGMTLAALQCTFVRVVAAPAGLRLDQASWALVGGSLKN